MTKPFPFLTICTADGDLSVPCEPIGEHFAIGPELGMTEDGTALLEGTFQVSLYPSGLRLSDDGGGCIHCARSAALNWARLPLDWPSLTADNGEEWVKAQPQEALTEFAHQRSLAFNCDAHYCEIDDADDRSFPMGDTVAIPASMLGDEPSPG